MNTDVSLFQLIVMICGFFGVLVFTYLFRSVNDLRVDVKMVGIDLAAYKLQVANDLSAHALQDVTMFVRKDEYQRDIDEIKSNLKELLQEIRGKKDRDT